MSTAPKVIIRRITAVRKLPKSNSKIIIKARSVVSAMAGNAFFPAANPDLDTVTEDIDAFEAAETFAQTRTAGAVQARDVAKEKVINDLRALTSYVQSIADGNYAEAEAIITSSGFDVKKQRSLNKQDFRAENGMLPGTVLLIAKGTALRTSHEWQSSPDGINWTQLDPTIQAKTLVTDLTPVTVMFFRHRVISKDGLGEWSQPKRIVVT